VTNFFVPFSLSLSLSLPSPPFSKKNRAEVKFTAKESAILRSEDFLQLLQGKWCSRRKRHTNKLLDNLDLVSGFSGKPK